MGFEGLFLDAVGIDISAGHLEAARVGASEAGLGYRYYSCDTNRAVLPEEGFDVVVNVAAAHHITHVERLFAAICEILPVDGWFVGYDYVGPH